LLVQIFGANVPIFVEGDEVKRAERVKGGEFHLRDIVEGFEPSRKADSGKRWIVEGWLKVVNFHSCSRHCGRSSVVGFELVDS
jgi:hypothetical protein